MVERSRISVIVAVLGLACLGIFVFVLLRPEPQQVDAPLVAGSSRKESLPRCKAIADDFVIGQLAPRLPPPELPPGIPELDGIPRERAEDDDLAPFATLMGRATIFAGGMAAGVLVEGEGGMVSAVVRVSADGRGQVVRLARSRGDLSPPVVIADDNRLVAGVLEPDGTGLKLRLARIADDVLWGAEIAQRLDESLGFDIAISQNRGVVVWDEVDREHVRIVLSSFRSTEFDRASSKRFITPAETEASTPRVFRRTSGGFLVAYLVHGNLIPAAGEGGGTQSPKDKRAQREVDETRGGEPLKRAYIEVVRLDETGAAFGDPVRVTPEEGQVTAYDAIAQQDDILFAYRDEQEQSIDGGTVHLAMLRSAGDVVSLNPSHWGTGDERLADGSPLLVDGWFSVPTRNGSVLLAKLDASGKLAERPLLEPSLGRGEPIAATIDTLYMAVPAGKAVRVRAFRCAAPAADALVNPKAPPDVDG